MKTKKLILPFLFLVLFSALGLFTFAQADLQHHTAAINSGSLNNNTSFLFSVMELPFLLIAVVFAFLTATALRGGKFGKGMYLVAWGFVVMAVGHLHMQIEHFYGLNIFKSILGDTVGSVAWFLALVATWGLSALGFYSIYKASKG
jgi:hypothetical protein